MGRRLTDDVPESGSAGRVDDRSPGHDFFERIGVTQTLLLHDLAQLPVESRVPLPPQALEDVEDRTLPVHAFPCVVVVPHGTKDDEPTCKEARKKAHLNDEPEGRQYSQNV